MFIDLSDLKTRSRAAMAGHIWFFYSDLDIYLLLFVMQSNSTMKHNKIEHHMYLRSYNHDSICSIKVNRVANELHSNKQKYLEDVF